ncbi:unnamed protein product, partial [Phaeothamnion confervicola]
PPRCAAAEVCRLIVAYFDIFCWKLCCFSDLAPYLALFVPTDMGGASAGGTKTGLHENGHATKAAAAATAASGAVIEARHQLLAYFCDAAAERAKGVKRLHRHIRALQVLRCLAVPMEVATVPAAQPLPRRRRLRAAAAALVAEYRATLHLNAGAEGGQREVQHGDELVLLAVHVLRDLCWQMDTPAPASTHGAAGGGGGGDNGGGGDDSGCGGGSEVGGLTAEGYLLRVETTALLEYAMKWSPYNYHFKVLAMGFYKELGAFERGVLLENELEIKQIQLDSLSWLLFPGCMRCAYFNEAHARGRGILALHGSCRRDTAEFAGRAFTHGNYSKAIEIAEFQERRMDASLQLALAKAEVGALQLTL